MFNTHWFEFLMESGYVVIIGGVPYTLDIRMKYPGIKCWNTSSTKWLYYGQYSTYKNTNLLPRDLSTFETYCTLEEFNLFYVNQM